MKLCPQCEFIYEDEQSFCDMDGTGLVHNPASDVNVSRLIIPLVANNSSIVANNSSTGPRSSTAVLAALVVIVLAGLVVAVYFARARQMRARRAPQPAQSSLQATDQPTQSSAQSTANQTTAAVDETAAAPSSEQTVASTSSASDQSDADSASLATASSRTSLAHARLNAGPVSASSEPANGRGPVIVRLTNGAAIRADEAWEKSDGVWYRQAGMVTFLKRGRVRSIERMAPTRPQSTAGNSASVRNPNQRGQKAATHDPLRIAKLEPVKAKKDNRVTSFLKKTGNFIKKPFKF